MNRRKKFKDLDLKEQERIREIISQKIDEAVTAIEDATGYFTEANYLILQDSLNKSLNIEIDLSMLVKPHLYDERRVQHYLKHNPHNCLNEPIIAYRWSHWYEIYNGVHRTECARLSGKKKIKANLIIPDKESLEKSNLI